MNAFKQRYLYHERKLEKQILDGLDVYTTKPVQRPYEKFILLDTYDLALNRAGIVLLAHNNRLVGRDGETLASAGLLKLSPPYSSDKLSASPLKKRLSEIIGTRPLLAASNAALAVRTFLIVSAENGQSVKVTEKRSANSQSGYLYVLSFGNGNDETAGEITAKLLACGFSETTAAQYLNTFFTQDPYAALREKPAAVSVVTGDESLEDVLKPVLISMGKRLRLVTDLFSGPYDPELLHDFRVTLRSLKSILFLKPALYKKEQMRDYAQLFSEMSAKSSPLRDLDVLLDNPSFHNVKTTHPKLYGTMKSKQAEYRGQWLKFCALPEVKQMLEDWEQFVNETAMADYKNFLALCRERFASTQAGLKKSLKKYTKKNTPENLHRLRIAIKRYRYHMTHVHPVSFEQDKQQIIKLTKKAQTVLGTFHDRSVQKRILAEYLAESEETPDKIGIKRLLPPKSEKKSVKLAIRMVKSFLK